MPARRVPGDAVFTPGRVTEGGETTVRTVSAASASKTSPGGTGDIGSIRYVSDRRRADSECWARDAAGRRPRLRSARVENRLELPVRKGRHRRLARWSRRGSPARQPRLGTPLRRGGSYGAAIYASIDDDPTCEQEKQLVAPYIRGWESVLGRHRVGRYANSKAIESALQDGLGSWFWQHNWGPPGRVAHPAAHRHQVEVDPRQVAGVGSTSITSTRPVSGGGTAEHYRPVRFASKLPVAAAAAGCVGPARAGPRVDAPRCR
ncbi:glycoside hydrolase domain-containing protein [[Mycobacterium] burgundiense]|uniref:glycoside hydrolase domain-containing protein n=1 Tax=[Mycobacterium] burgundiense TaxID=3064286 RepID=UPI0035A1C271